jgi:hypothetical protein
LYQPHITIKVKVTSLIFSSVNIHQSLPTSSSISQYPQPNISISQYPHPDISISQLPIKYLLLNITNNITNSEYHQPNLNYDQALRQPRTI